MHVLFIDQFQKIKLTHKIWNLEEGERPGTSLAQFSCNTKQCPYDLRVAASDETTARETFFYIKRVLLTNATPRVNATFSFLMPRLDGAIRY